MRSQAPHGRMDDKGSSKKHCGEAVKEIAGLRSHKEMGPSSESDREGLEGKARQVGGSYGEARVESGCLRCGPIGTSERRADLSISLMHLSHRRGFHGIVTEYNRVQLLLHDIVVKILLISTGLLLSILVVYRFCRSWSNCRTLIPSSMVQTCLPLLIHGLTVAATHSRNTNFVKTLYQSRTRPDLNHISAHDLHRIVSIFLFILSLYLRRPLPLPELTRHCT